MPVSTLARLRLALARSDEDTHRREFCGHVEPHTVEAFRAIASCRVHRLGAGPSVFLKPTHCRLPCGLCMPNVRSGCITIKSRIITIALSALTQPLACGRVRAPRGLPCACVRAHTREAASRPITRL